MNIIEITQKFPTELDCVIHAEKIRYGKKVKCAYCGSANLSKRRPDYRHKCLNCNKSTSVTINTPLQGTKVPLQTWFFAISVITDAKKGISALQLQRNLSISYPTSFAMYHKIRGVMAQENKQTEDLAGIVEMDEVYIGGKPRKLNNPYINAENKKSTVRVANAKGKTRKGLDEQIKELNNEGFNFSPNAKHRGKIDNSGNRGRATNNIPVVGIVQRNGDVVAEVMRHLTYDNLKKMVQKYVDTDNSVLVTDNYPSYNSMKKIINHIKIDHNQLYSYKGVNSNTIESFWAIIERGIMGQYHSVSPKMLPNYVAEFVYKYNNRHNNGKMFTEIVKELLKPTSL